MDSSARSSSLAITVLCASAVFSMLYLLWLASFGLFGEPWFIVALVGIKAVIEIVASLYAVTFLCAAVAYLRVKDDVPDCDPVTPPPRVAVVYLCCGDLDVRALRSLAALRYDGELAIVVHDDATAATERATVDAAVADVAARTPHRVALLRRPARMGGKPAAVNFVLDQIADKCDWFVLCDNDSIALDPDCIGKALRRCHDPSVAVVQFRTMGVAEATDSAINRRLAESVNAFHLFLRVWSRFGWMPFIGHNALLRMSAVREIGGFTPGYFADDVDLTVRLNVAGHRVVYAPEIHMGETHPASYAALRKRSFKWAYGCMQVLKAHARRVLTSPSLTIAEKFGFLQFAGFYVGQTLVLGYLVLAFLVSPFVVHSMGMSFVVGLILGSGMVIGVFLPVLVYFAREGRLLRSVDTVVLFGLAYGATDFVCVRGVWDCLCNRARTWVPTNVSNRNAGEAVLVAEACFGLLLLAVPLVFHPELLWVPSAYVFGAKFLFAPSLGRWYHQDARWQTRHRHRVAATATLLALILTLVMIGGGSSSTASSGAVAIDRKNLSVDGNPFLIKGVHYSPWRPGTGPGRQYPYPDRAAIDADLTLLAKLGANTILVFDAPDVVLDVAHGHGLRVLYTFEINWWSVPLDDRARQQLLARVRTLRGKPAVLAWILGNEVPAAVLDAKGGNVVVGELEALYRSIKAVDPTHPISHSNWVTTKDLPLQFLDFASFNVYPLWPPQVVALGYDGYLNRILRPIAGDKPLVITEFGVNTLEAGGEEEQGAILERTWRALRRTDAAGGVVMEFADEWWKNYNNPRHPRDWWDRAFAPADELKHDEDPEEYYGLVTGERQPKAAFAVVARMFGSDGPGASRFIPAIIVAVIAQASLMAWFFAWRAKRRHS